MSTPTDVSQLSQQDLPEAAFPGGKELAFRVYFRPEAHAEAWAHANGTAELEICGVLVGRWARDAAGPYVHVEHVIQGEAAASKHAEVTFTHDTWSKINAKMDSDYSELSIVGWYHSHPDFGVFLSEKDRFIQESFFSNPGQVAHVIDPVRKTEGVFVWKEGKTDIAPTFWVGNDLKTSTPAGEEASRPTAVTGTPTPTDAPATPTAAKTDWLMTAFLAVCMFALGALLPYFFQDRLDDAEASRIRNRSTAEAMLNLGIRPGLRDKLTAVAADAAAAYRDARSLRDEHLDAVEDEEDREELEERWDDTLQRLRHAAQLALDSRDLYAPNERALRELEMLLNRAKAEREARKSGGTGKEEPKKEPPAEKETEKKPEEKNVAPKKQD